MNLKPFETVVRLSNYTNKLALGQSHLQASAIHFALFLFHFVHLVSIFVHPVHTVPQASPYQTVCYHNHNCHCLYSDWSALFKKLGVKRLEHSQVFITHESSLSFKTSHVADVEYEALQDISPTTTT